MGNRNTAPAVFSPAEESEVLLPPGTFKVLRRSAMMLEEGQRIMVVDVAYAPGAEYLRRGVLPAMVGPNTLRYKTTGGHQLDMQSKTMARRYMERRPVVAAAPRFGLQRSPSITRTRAARR